MPDAQTDRQFMQIALDVCREGIDAGQSPFGSCIVRNGQLLAATHNNVWAHTDPSAHAEVECIREACSTLSDINLHGTTIYATTEPCPMCFTCIHWARIERIVFAARVSDATAFGFGELQITNATMKDVSGSPVQITPDFMRDDALALFEYWQQQGGKAY